MKIFLASLALNVLFGAIFSVTFENIDFTVYVAIACAVILFTAFTEKLVSHR